MASASAARAFTPTEVPAAAFSAMELSAELLSEREGSNSSTSMTLTVNCLETVLVLLLESVEVATTVKEWEVLDS